MQMSLSSAMKKNEGAAKIALKSELLQFINLRIWELTHKRNVPREFLDKIVPSSAVFKEKFKPNGDFDKLKARLVANGNLQEISALERKQSSSPTVSTVAVMAVIGVSVFLRWRRCAIDFTAAYLNADIPNTQYMLLQPQVVEALLELQPEAREFVCPNGTLIVLLRKAIYGLVESARLWYDTLSAVLISLGFIKSSADNCVFVLRNSNGEAVCIVCVYVDDLFVTAPLQSIIDKLYSDLSAKFNALSMQTGKKINYLGMEITFDDDVGSATISQLGYLQDMLTKFKISGTASYPSSPDLFTVDSASPATDATYYRSMVMSVFYLAKRTRPDVLLPVAYLASRCAAPTVSDLQKVVRVLMYLNATQHLPLVLQPESLDIFVGIDASFGAHPDGKGHSGMFISFGRNGGTLFAQSSKQRIVTKSSTESELVGLSDGLSQVMWIRSLMRDLGMLSDKPTTIWQDNQATIRIATNGPGQKGRTKHMDVRYFFIVERINAKEIILEWLPTGDMVADIFTKPLGGAQFVKLRGLLLNVRVVKLP